MRDLQPSDHGRRFSASIENNFVEGKVCFENDEYYLCQNVRNGNPCSNKFGYSLSWTVNKGNEKGFNECSVTNFKFINMTAKEIEEYKDFKKGDVLKLKHGKNLLPIIEQLGDVLFTQPSDSFCISLYTAETLYNAGWRLNVAPEKEISPIVELSVAEIAKKLGLSPEQLKVIDK